MIRCGLTISAISVDASCSATFRNIVRAQIGQLTTGELARERSRLEAALKGPFSEDVKALLRRRLDAVLAEQDERSRKREADTAAAKAALAAGSADRAARAAREAGG
jgi:hypothetical protein